MQKEIGKILRKASKTTLQNVWQWHMCENMLFCVFYKLFIWRIIDVSSFGIFYVCQFAIKIGQKHKSQTCIQFVTGIYFYRKLPEVYEQLLIFVTACAVEPNDKQQQNLLSRQPFSF